jgi:hypothetical protein
LASQLAALPAGNTQSPSPSTQLAGRRLTEARLGWAAVVLLELVVFLVAIPAEIQVQAGLAQQLYAAPLFAAGLSSGAYAAVCTFLDLALTLTFMVIGVIIFWRKSDDWMALLTSLTCMVFPTLFVPSLVFLVQAQPAWSIPVALLRAIGQATSLIVPYYLFPNGQWVPRVTRWLAKLWIACTVVWFLSPAAPFNNIYVGTYLRTPRLSYLTYLAFYATGVLAQVYRYRRIATPLERQQTRWVVLGTTAAVVSYAAYQLAKIMVPALDQPGAAYIVFIFGARPLYYALVACAPLCIGISILKYRLWNIDIIIRRTLIYGVLSGLLVFIYAAAVLVLQQMFRTVIGQGSVLAIVAATLGTAALFQPLRGRVQAAIDRRFYRSRYNAARVLAAFSSTIRNDVDLNTLSERLVSVVEETMQPAQASLWLKRKL